MLPTLEDPAELLVTLEFLESYLADVRAKSNLDTAAYLTRFPRIAGRIQQEFDSLDADADSGDFIAGRFRIITELGRGGQGVVWLAEDTGLHNRQVALKVIALRSGVSVVARFHRETRAVLRLELPGICPLLDAGIDTDAGVAWIAMRYVHGESFDRWLQHQRDMHADEQIGWRPVVERIAEAAEICAGVHRQGIVHRDLKPGNLQISDGDVVVLDFGIAKDLREVESSALTVTGDVVGTPSYMAPEQIEDRRHEIGPHTDVYALGLVLLEALASSPPASDDPSSGQSNGRPIRERPLPNGLPRDLHIVVDTALRERPTERYQSAAELSCDLRSILAGDPIRSSATRTWRRVGRWARQQRVTLATAAVVATLLALIAYSVLDTKRLEYAASVQHDGQTLANLKTTAEDLLATPGGLPDLQAWIADAEKLQERVQKHEGHLRLLRTRGRQLEETATDRRRREACEGELNRVRAQVRLHRRRVESLEKSAMPESKKQRPLRWARRGVRHGEEIARFWERKVREALPWQFDREEDANLHQRVLTLVMNLREFALPRPGRSTILRTKLWFGSIEQVTRTMRDHARSWAETIQRVADREQSPLYEGLRLSIQTGLVPLGRDPATTLEEFAHVASGTIPTRNTQDDRLKWTEDSAMVFVLLPGGRFRMGHAGLAETSPVHTVELAPLLFGKHEMTAGQFERLTFQFPNLIPRGAKLTDGRRMSAAHPAENVAWLAGQRVLRRFGLTYPTEAQWEYACRGLPGVEPASGPLDQRANLADRHAARFEDPTFRHERNLDDGHWFHAPVGSFAPNSFGLYDLLGNVAEWCMETQAWYSRKIEDGTGRRAPDTSGARIVRGGSFRSVASQARCWTRAMRPPHLQNDDVGVRAVRNLTRTDR